MSSIEDLFRSRLTSIDNQKPLLRDLSLLGIMCMIGGCVRAKNPQYSHFHFLVTLISNTIPLASSFNTRQETILLFFVLIFDCNPLFIHSSQIHLHVSSFSILFFVVWKKHSEIFMAQNRFILCMRHVNYRQNVESAWKNVHGLD